MIEIPEDPIEVWKRRLHSFALTLMDENLIIGRRDMSNQPNEIEALGIGYEKLDSEAVLDASARKYVARQLRLFRQSTHKRYFPTVALQHLKKAQ